MRLLVSIGPLLLVTGLTAALPGCGSSGVDGLDLWLAGDRLEDDRLAAEHREQFAAQGDPESLQWLLSNRIATGMTETEVAHELGQEGERLYGSGHLKRGDSRYLESDVFYKWGPASDGRSVYLAFRDDRLLHFDADEFAAE